MFHISNLISLFEIIQFKCGIIMRFMIIISALALADYAVSHVGFVKGGIKNGNRNLISFCSATSSNAIKIFRKLKVFTYEFKNENIRSEFCIPLSLSGKNKNAKLLNYSK
jgi:hypothetical protein